MIKLSEKIKSATTLLKDAIENGAKTILIKLETIISNQEKIIRSQERIENLLNTIDSDRSIFEDIQGSLSKLAEEWRMTRQHDVESKQDIKLTTQNASAQVEATVEKKIGEVKEIIENKKTLVVDKSKLEKKGFWGRIFKK